MAVASLTEQVQEGSLTGDAPDAALKWGVPDLEFEEIDDPVDEAPFSAEELKQLALAAGLRVLEG